MSPLFSTFHVFIPFDSFSLLYLAYLRFIHVLDCVQLIHLTTNSPALGNCEPRKELTLLETKKNGPNKGKFFYKCFDCDLFLWWDAAKARETGLTPSKNAAQPPQPKTPSLTQQPLTAYGYQRTPGGGLQADPSIPDVSDSDEDLALDDAGAPEAAGMQTPCPPSSKRKRDVFEDDEFSDLESDEERQMVEIADKSAEKLQAQQRAYATPSNTRSTDIIAGLPTPSVARTLFPAPASENKRQKQVTFEDVSLVSPATEATLGRDTPATTPARSLAPPPSSPPNDGYDVTDEVMALLRDQNLSPDVLRSVQSTLATAARRAKGIALGRDSARASLKTRDDKIASMQERITALENREKMHRSQVTNIKANLMKMYEDN